MNLNGLYFKLYFLVLFSGMSLYCVILVCHFKLYFLVLFSGMSLYCVILVLERKTTKKITLYNDIPENNTRK